MSRHLDRMFEGADNFLLGLSEKARSNDEQRRYFDTKGLVRKHRGALTSAFQKELAAAFLPGAEQANKPASADVSFDEINMAKTRTIEESIAVNNIARKAEDANQKALDEVTRRLDFLIHERGAAASPLALSPATLCNAFRLGTQALDLDFQHELVIYKLFDKLVVAGLNEVYAEALKLLEGGGVTAAVLKTARRPAPAARPREAGPGGRPPSSGAQADEIPDWASATTGFVAQTPGFEAPSTRFAPMPGAGSSAGRTAPLARGGGQATGSMPALDARTLDALRWAQGQPLIAANYGDADLATELSHVASGQAVAGWGPAQARANIQCADLVGKMFNGIVEDPSVPQALKPQIDEMRFAVIKSAMADRSFFSSPDHPIRKLVNELATMAAAARTTGPGSAEQLASLLGMIQSQFQVAARDVRAAAATATPLADTDAERFLDEQLVQNKARRQALIDKARQVVREVLQLRLAGHTVPDAAQPMLLAGLAPLLGLRLLRKGMDSEGWREGVERLEKVIDGLDPRPGTTAEAGMNEALCAQIERELLEAGMLAARTAELLAGLRQGFELAARRPAAVSAAPAPAPAPKAPLELLLRLLMPGDWFKVYDAERKQTRWLKVAGQHLDDTREDYRGRVEFAEFSGQNTLLVKVDELLDDIAAGRTEPFDQSPGARATLGELIEVSSRAKRGIS